MGTHMHADGTTQKDAPCTNLEFLGLQICIAIGTFEKLSRLCLLVEETMYEYLKEHHTQTNMTTVTRLT